MQTLTPSQLKLYELLKTDEQVKWLMEKLEFWCFIMYENYICKFLNKTDFWDYRVVKKLDLISYDLLIKKEDRFEVIWWLPLSEHFLRLYCKNKWIKLVIQANWVVKIINFWWKELDKEIITIITNLDNTKSFDNQEDRVYNRICETLINL